MLIAKGNKVPSRIITFASLLHILLKETSVRGCDILALRKRVQQRVLGKICLVVRYTIGTTSAIFFFNQTKSRNWPKSSERFNYIMLTLNLNIYFYLNVFTLFKDVNS